MKNFICILALTFSTQILAESTDNRFVDVNLQDEEQNRLVLPPDFYCDIAAQNYALKRYRACREQGNPASQCRWQYQDDRDLALEICDEIFQ